MKWKDGSPMSHLSAVLFWGFVPIWGICFLLSYVPRFENLCGVMIVLGILIFFAGYISMLVDQRRYRRSLLTEYERNSPKHQSVFASEPANIEPASIKDEQLFSLYDHATADYIGDISGRELCFLIKCYEKWGHEHNDFFVMPETVEVLRAEGLPQSVTKLLDAALAKRQDSIEVRWAEKVCT
jgi:hypothetical protein